MVRKFKCKQCGRCCLRYGACLQATDEDIEMWELGGREDILEWVNPFGDLWINLKKDREAKRCPWLRKLPRKNKYICRINNLKPEVCREYPVDKRQAVSDKCRGIVK